MSIFSSSLSMLFFYSSTVMSLCFCTLLFFFSYVHNDYLALSLNSFLFDAMLLPQDLIPLCLESSQWSFSNLGCGVKKSYCSNPLLFSIAEKDIEWREIALFSLTPFIISVSLKLMAWEEVESLWSKDKKCLCVAHSCSKCSVGFF